MAKTATTKLLKKPYKRVLIPDEVSGTFTAQILEFPGCVAEGSSPAEAYERLEKVAESWIEAALEMGQEIPLPSSADGASGRFALRLPRSLHRQAANLAEMDGCSLNQFIVTAIAERVGASTLYRTIARQLRFSFAGTSAEGGTTQIPPQLNKPITASTPPYVEH
ncbi:MAG: toxin-antitoxin system HicB family antitoxin [Thermoanaerobaculia bacterium]